MLNRIRRHWLLACALAVVGALVAVVLVGYGGMDERGGSAHDYDQSGYRSIIISGDVRGPMTPGVRSAIELQFANRHVVPLLISDIRVEVREVSAPHADGAHPCTVADFAVEQVPRETEVRIPAGAKRSLSELELPRRAWPWLALVDRPVNQDGCNGASLKLSYSATGAIEW